MKTQYDDSQIVLLKWNFVYNLAIAGLTMAGFIALRSPWVFLLLILALWPRVHQGENNA